MKNKIYLIAAAAMLSAAAACNKAEISEADKAGEASTGTPIKLNISVSDLSSDTKAVKSCWKDGDIIHLWLDNTTFEFTGFAPGKSYAARLTYDAGQNEWTVRNLDESLLKESGGYIRGLYEASNLLFSATDNAKRRNYGNNIDVEDAALWGNINCYNKQGHPFVWYDGPGALGTRGRYGFVTAVCDHIPYTYDKGTKMLAAKIDKWRFLTDFQLVVTGLDYEKYKYTLYSEQIYSVQTIDVMHGDAPYECRVADYEKSESDGPLLKAGQEDGNIAAVENADGIAFVGKLRYPGEAKQYTFTLVEVQRKTTNNKETEVKNTYTLTIPTEKTLDSQDGAKLISVKVPFSSFQ